jgi:hypothetical protein
MQLLFDTQISSLIARRRYFVGRQRITAQLENFFLPAPATSAMAVLG